MKNYYAAKEYPDFLVKHNLRKKRSVNDIIVDVLTRYENDEIDYPEDVRRSYEKIYQAVNHAFDYDEQYAVDSCYRDIPPVDNTIQ